MEGSNITSPSTQQQQQDTNGQQQVLQSVEELVEELRRSIIVVEEFQSQSQQLLFDKLNKIIGLYERIENQKHHYNNIEIPFEIFRVIDQSKNPDLFVKESLQNCLSANEKTKGKIESIKGFKNELDKHIASAFPDEYKDYVDLKNRPPEVPTTTTTTDDQQQEQQQEQLQENQEQQS
eukprot:gene846-1055_t